MTTRRLYARSVARYREVVFHELHGTLARIDVRAHLRPTARSHAEDAS